MLGRRVVGGVHARSWRGAAIAVLAGLLVPGVAVTVSATSAPPSTEAPATTVVEPEPTEPTSSAPETVPETTVAPTTVPPATVAPTTVPATTIAPATTTTTTTTTTTAPVPDVQVLAATSPTCTVAVELGAPWMPGTRCLETTLRAQGRFTGTPDDLFDSATAAAVRSYQTGAVLPVTGRANQATLQSMGIWRRPSATCTVGVDLGASWMPGNACLERRLAQLGLFGKAPDDFFDYDTAVGVSLFQQSVGRAGTSDPTIADLQSMGIWSRPAATCTVAVTLGAPWMPGTACLERRLAQLGLFRGIPNDLFDWDTAVAVSHFQQSSGRRGTGAPTLDDLLALGIWRQPNATCGVSVRLGSPWMPGNRCLEQRLAGLGLFAKTPDDFFDYDTAVGVSLYQQSIGARATSHPTLGDLQRLGIWTDPGSSPCKVPQIPSSTYHRGSTCLETRLAELGLFNGVPDEVYDWNTAVGVSLYRQSIGQSGAGDGDAYTMFSLGILDNPNPLPANSGDGRRVVYSRSAQRVWAVDEQGNVVKSHAVSGRLGVPRAGTYHVFSRSLYTYSSGNSAVRWMYMIRFTTGPNGGNIGFHEIPKKNGVPLQSHQQLGLALSAGCVRQTTPDAIWMWNWAPVGTKVVVL